MPLSFFSDGFGLYKCEVFFIYISLRLLRKITEPVPNKLMGKTSRLSCDSEGSVSMLQDGVMSVLDNPADEISFVSLSNY